jgi:hypothetical protein
MLPHRAKPEGQESAKHLDRHPHLNRLGIHDVASVVDHEGLLLCGGLDGILGLKDSIELFKLRTGRQVSRLFLRYGGEIKTYSATLRLGK